LSTHSGAINDAVTVDWIGAQLDTLSSSDEIRAALKLLSVVSWQMRRDGDSNPVEVCGTYKQLGEYLFATFSHVDSDVLSLETGIDIATIRKAIHAAEDR
jgi:methionine synthase I (cobalamin-dependent)